MKKEMIYIIPLLLIGVLLWKCTQQNDVIPTIPPGVEEVKYSDEVILESEISAALNAIAKGKVDGEGLSAKAGIKMLRSKVQSGEIKVANHKRILDALDKLEESVAKGLLPDDDRTVNLRFELIQLMAGVEPVLEDRSNEKTIWHHEYIHFLAQFTYLKLKLEFAANQIDPSKLNRFNKRKTIYSERIDSYVQRISMNPLKQFTKPQHEKEIAFLADRLDYFESLLIDFLDNHVLKEADVST